MRNSSFIGVLVLGLLMAVFNACSEPRDFAAHMRTLDSLQSTLTNTQTEFNNVALFAEDSLTRHLVFIQNNYNETMPLSMARTLLRAGNFRDQLQQLNQWKENLNYRGEKLKSEMTALHQTLQDRATHDANNHPVTMLYADSLVEELTVAQQFWHTKINEWIILETQLSHNLVPLNDSLTYWTDSLQQAIRK